MTAEIALYNRHAVALAADSLVTISVQQEGRKTYSVNKVFALSKHHPVGVMFYGRADVLGLSWETLVKTYRRSLKTDSFATVRGYAEHFLTWLDSQGHLFPENRQRASVESASLAIFGRIAKRVVTEIAGGTTKSHGEVLREQLREYYDWLVASRRCPINGDKVASEIPTTYSAEVEGPFNHFLSGFGADALSLQFAKELIGEAFARTDDCDGLSVAGIVICGFGEEEFFPTVCEAQVKSYVCDVLVRDHLKEWKEHANGDRQADILPFAQEDVVQSFIYGLEPRLEEFVHDSLENALSQLPASTEGFVEEELGKGHPAAAKIRTKMKSGVHALLTAFQRDLQEYQIRNNLWPLLNVIQFLPKEELAKMAEALVNITSIKRKMSLDLETVGGPIDVALITKGDGFVWIQRKQYFDPKLNPFFLQTYGQR